MRWGDGLGRLSGTFAVVARSLTSGRRVFGVMALLEALAVATLVYALLNTTYVRSSSCSSESGLFNCFHRAHDTRLFVLAGCLAAAGAVTYLIGRLHESR
jgi:hypothetical protein